MNPCDLRALSLGAILLVLMAAAARAEDPQPPPPPAEETKPSPLDGLPGDCVFVLYADLAEAGARFDATPFGKFVQEPDSLAFFQHPVQLAAAAYAEWRKRIPELPATETLLGLFKGRAALGLSLVPAPDPQVPPRAEPTLVIRLQDPGAVRASLAGFLEVLPVEKLSSGVEARGRPGLYLAMLGDLFFYAASRERLDAAVSAAKEGKPAFAASERWQKVRAQAGEDCQILAWADLKPIREHLLRLPDDPDARAALPPCPAKVLAALGLDGVQSLALGLRIEGPHFDYRIALEAPERKGLLKLIEGEGPLKAGELAAVPPEAGWFYLARMDSRRLLPLLKEGLTAATGEATVAQQIGLGLLAFKMLAGVDIEADLIGGFGDTWLVCDTGGGGALLDLMPGIAVTATAKDPRKLEAALAKVWQQMAGAAPKPLDARARNSVVDGINVHYLSLALTDISPAFAVIGNRVVLSPTLSGLRRQARHVAALPQADDIRTNKRFQAAYLAAFGKALPAEGEDKDAFPLPSTLRYLDPAAAEPTRLLGTLFGAASAFGQDLPEILQTEAGLRRARLQAGLRMLSEAVQTFRKDAGEAPQPLPDTPRKLLEKAGGAAAAADLSGIHYRAGLQSGDAEDSVLAWAYLDTGPEASLLVLRLAGQLENWKSTEAAAMLAQQDAAFAAQERKLRVVSGEPAPQGRAGAWWARVWRMQEEERSILALDGMRILREFDFAMLPDLLRFDRSLPAGVSWTTAGEWGVVSRTFGCYPLPAADLAGALVPMAIGHVSVPELYKSWRANNEAAAIAALETIASAQDLYRLADWDGDGVHAYAPTLKELLDRGLLDDRTARAEVREGAFPAPRSGYLFRLLPEQSAAAPGGAKSYVADGRWTQGFAVLAWPLDYPNSGQRTFLMGPSGAIYQADHGIFTKAMSRSIKAYDPDPRQGWRRE